jgi:hypothetical protein
MAPYKPVSRCLSFLHFADTVDVPAGIFLQSIEKHFFRFADLVHPAGVIAAEKQFHLL